MQSQQDSLRNLVRNALQIDAQKPPELARALEAMLVESHPGGQPEKEADPSEAETVDASAAATLPDSGAARPVDRYRVLRVHAEGGLGEVSVAQDQELNREVALKTIREDFDSDDAALSRFLLEAQVTGALEHPGIVPVYGLGEGPDGKPHYAMRFIRGESLKDAVPNVHASTEDEHRRGIRRLLQRLIDVCNAVEYAHSRGVIHRDIKPANIMLGKYGETLVVDWGLAKVIGRDDSVPDDGESTVSPESGSGVGTLVGRAIGTPNYMPPEQAEGRLADIGPTSDVYSLGATLYFILTGKRPFGGQQISELLASVQAGHFPRPSRIKPDVPPAMEAICLRAMSKEPTDRYQSPRAFADDIERYLADEPVLAHADSFTERSRRWSRKHPRIVSGALAGAVITVACVLGFSVVLSGKNDELRTSNIDLVKQQQRTRDALDAISSQVIEDWLTQQRSFDDKQKAFLERSLAMYEAFADETQDDVASQLGVAKAQRQVGQVRGALGDTEEAIKSYQRALEILTKLSESNEKPNECDQLVADTNRSLGMLYNRDGQRDNAEAALNKAMSGYETLSANGDDHRKQVARVHYTLGRVHFGRADLNAAIKELDKAREIRAALLAEAPGDEDRQRDLAEIALTRGYVLKRLNRGDEAEETFKESIQIMEGLPESDKNNWIMGVLLNDLGVYYKENGQKQKTAPLYDRAMELREDLVRRFPNEAEYNVMFMGSLLNLGNLRRVDGNPAESLKHYSRGVEVADGVLERSPNYVRARKFVRNMCEGKAEAHMRLSDFQKALECWDEAIAHNAPAYKLNDVRFDVRLPLRRAATLVRLGRLTEAIAITKKIVTESSSGTALDEMQYHAPPVYSMASTVTTDPTEREAYLAEARRLLEEALKTKYFGSGSKGFAWHEDPELEAVREHEDSAELLEKYGPEEGD